MRKDLFHEALESTKPVLGVPMLGVPVQGALVTLALACVLVSCRPTPPALPASQPCPGGMGPAELRLDSSLPLNVQREMRDWYARLPCGLKAGVTVSPEIVFTASDGRVDRNSATLAVRTGTVVQSARGRAIQLAHGLGEVAYPAGGAPPLLSQNYTCNQSDGPYFRSWTLPGYAGISSVLRLDRAASPDTLSGQYVATYAYTGAQVQGQSDVDAGLVFLNGKLRVFFTSPAAPAPYVEAAAGLTLGEAYRATLAVSAPGSYLFRVDRQGKGSVLFNIRARGANSAGGAQYFKRAVSIASKALGRYNGSEKFGLQGHGRHEGSTLGRFEVGDYRQRPYASGQLSSASCQWPSASLVQLDVGTPAGNDVSVDIAMSR